MDKKEKEFADKLLEYVKLNFDYIKKNDIYEVDQDWGNQVIMKGDYGGKSLNSLFRYLDEKGLIKVKYL